jgi:hypothetical protein
VRWSGIRLRYGMRPTISATALLTCGGVLVLACLLCFTAPRDSTPLHMSPVPVFAALRPADTPQPTTGPFSQPTAVGSSPQAPDGASSDIGASGLMIATVLGCITGVIGAIVALIALIVLLRGGYGPVVRAILRRPRKGRRGERGAAEMGRGYARGSQMRPGMGARGAMSRPPMRPQPARRR